MQRNALQLYFMYDADHWTKCIPIIFKYDVVLLHFSAYILMLYASVDPLAGGGGRGAPAGTRGARKIKIKK